MTQSIARPAFLAGHDPAQVARGIAEQLDGPGLRLALVFADRRLEASVLPAIADRLPGPVVGCTTTGLVGPIVGEPAPPAVVGLGLYGDWLRVGIGAARGLASSGDGVRAGLAAGRRAVDLALRSLGVAADALDPARHTALTLLDGASPQAQAFALGAAACAPRIWWTGGGAAAELAAGASARVFVAGELSADAGAVIAIESELPFFALRSSHLVATDLKTVVTAASGRVVTELDGRPAVDRLRQLVGQLGDPLELPCPAHALARLVDDVPSVRSILRIEGPALTLAGDVEVGHVLRVMRPGDLLATTRTALATAAERVGGTIAACVTFSSGARHAEAARRGASRALATLLADAAAIGPHTLCEQAGLLLANHTMTGLAIGAPKP